MNEDKLEKTREYIDAIKDMVDNMKITEQQNQCLSEFIYYFELMVENRELTNQSIREYILPGYRRMSDMIGSEDDNAVIELMEGIIE